MLRWILCVNLCMRVCVVAIVLKIGVCAYEWLYDSYTVWCVLLYSLNMNCAEILDLVDTCPTKSKFSNAKTGSLKMALNCFDQILINLISAFTLNLTLM